VIIHVRALPAALMAPNRRRPRTYPLVVF
jgi:hypothetical protein